MSAVSPHTRDMMKGEDGELVQKDHALFLFDATRDRHMTSLKKRKEERKEVCKTFFIKILLKKYRRP